VRKLGRKILEFIFYFSPTYVIMISKCKRYDEKCSHPLFKKKQPGHKKNEIHEDEPNKKVPVTYDSVKNAVVGDSMAKKK